MTDKLREAAQMALDALEWNLHTDLDNIPACTKWLNTANKTAEALRAALAQPQKDLELPLVQAEEFVKLIEGKENFRGIPVMRTEWPTRGEALAQPEPEPVLWAAKESMFMWGKSDEHGHPYHIICKGQKVRSHQIPLYTAPPQRDDAPAKAVEWQGMTDEEIEQFGYDWLNGIAFEHIHPFTRAIEAKLREKSTLKEKNDDKR